MDRFQVVVLVILVGIQVIRSIRDRMKKPEAEVRDDAGREPEVERVEQEETFPSASPVANDWQRAVAVREVTELVAQRAHQPNAAPAPVATPASVRRGLTEDLVRASVIGKTILDPAPGWRWFRR